MSVEAMTWAFEQDVSGGDKVLLLALADHVGPDGTCYPGQKKLAAKCSVSDRAIRDSIKRLEARDLLYRERRNREDGSRTSDRYVLALPEETPAPTGSSAGDNRKPASRQESPVGPTENPTAAIRREDWPLSHLLADLCAEADPNGLRPTVTKEWADAERLMLERDGRNREAAEDLLRWAKGDEFWATNIRSMPKFRKQYGQLWERRKQSQPRQLNEWGEEVAA